MKGNESRIVGYIEQNNRFVTFFGEDHHFIFIPERHANIHALQNERLLYSNSGKNNGITVGRPVEVLIKADNGFVKGSTIDGRTILIYTGGDIELNPVSYINTWLYIVSDNQCMELDFCDAIGFESGILKSLFYQSAIQIKNDVPVQNDDSIIVDIKECGIEKIIIASIITKSRSAHEGLAINDSDVELRMIFNSRQRITSAFIQRYYDILTMCQFMTYRKNICFDKVSLLRSYNNGQIKVADCYIKPDYETDSPRMKDRCITFNSLGEKCIEELFKIIMYRNAIKSQFTVDFIPRSNQDVSVVDDRRLRDVCTSLEKENELNRIKPLNKKAYKDLVDKIKVSLDNSKKSPDSKLTDREYSYISGNIKHWSGPAAELDKQLFDKYKKDIGYLMDFVGIEDLSEKDIHRVLRIRDSLTHGKGAILFEKPAKTVFVLTGVVYASVLTRCGCSEEQIQYWINGGLLNMKL